MPEIADRSLAMLAAALEKEEFGRDFYAKAYKESQNELGRTVSGPVSGGGYSIARIKRIYEAALPDDHGLTTGGR